jgi:hypothetical protein
MGFIPEQRGAGLINVIHPEQAGAVSSDDGVDYKLKMFAYKERAYKRMMIV